MYLDSAIVVWQAVAWYVCVCVSVCVCVCVCVVWYGGYYHKMFAQVDFVVFFLEF